MCETWDCEDGLVFRFLQFQENVGWETCWMPWAFNRPLGAYFWKWVPITNSTMLFGSSYWKIANNGILHVFLGSLWYHFACVVFGCIGIATHRPANHLNWHLPVNRRLHDLCTLGGDMSPCDFAVLFFVGFVLWVDEWVSPRVRCIQFHYHGKFRVFKLLNPSICVVRFWAGNKKDFGNDLNKSNIA